MGGARKENTSTGLSAAKVALMAARSARAANSAAPNVNFARRAGISMKRMIASHAQHTVIRVLHQSALSVPMGSNRLTQELRARQSSATTDNTSIVLITDVTSVPTTTIALYVLTPLLAMHARMAIICTLRQKHAKSAIPPV